MDFLQTILGGQQQQDYQDFVNRYDQGHPSEGYSDQEVLNRYQQVAPRLSPEQYQQAALASLNRLAPQERMQLGHYLMQQAQQQGVGLPGFLQGGIGDSQDPNDLAQHHDPNNWGPIWTGLRTTLTALLLLSLFGLAVGLSAINAGTTAQGSVAAGRPSNQGRIPR